MGSVGAPYKQNPVFVAQYDVSTMIRRDDAPLAGVNTLGDPIINVSTYGSTGRLAAAIVVAVLAILTELALGAAQRAVTPAGLKLESNPTSRRKSWFTNGRKATT